MDDLASSTGVGAKHGRDDETSDEPFSKQARTDGVSMPIPAPTDLSIGTTPTPSIPTPISASVSEPTTLAPPSIPPPSIPSPTPQPSSVTAPPPSVIPVPPIPVPVPSPDPVSSTIPAPTLVPPPPTSSIPVPPSNTVASTIPIPSPEPQSSAIPTPSPVALPSSIPISSTAPLSNIPAPSTLPTSSTIPPPSAATTNQSSLPTPTPVPTNLTDQTPASAVQPVQSMSTPPTPAQPPASQPIAAPVATLPPSSAAPPVTRPLVPPVNGSTSTVPTSQPATLPTTPAIPVTLDISTTTPAEKDKQSGSKEDEVVDDEVFPVAMPPKGMKAAVPDTGMTATQRADFKVDEKSILPRRGIEKVLQRLGLSKDVQLHKDVELAIISLAENMLDSTMEFACLMASRRQSKWLEAKDATLYLERNWNLHLPGYGNNGVHPAPKLDLENPEMKRQIAVRQALGALTPVVPDSIAARQAALEGNIDPKASTDKPGS